MLKDYGYATSAFGKWHNTPVEETTAAGPFDHWPAGYGFEYFYGFLAGEASQYEPCLVRNTTYVQHPRTSGGHDYYHLSEDLADDAINYLHRHKAFEPDRPFFMYWASGAVHGPHQVMKEWADKYKGKFDDGWDKYRERAFERAKKLGWIPADAVNTPRPADLASWDSIPEDQKPFQRRLMEVYAGFAEHVDHEVGRLVDEIDNLGYGDNTLILYIWGDNGASAEGQDGTISELLAQERHSFHARATHQGPQRPGRPRRAWLAQDREHVSRRLGLGRRRPLQGDQAPRVALRRHAQPHGRPLARADQARPHAARPVPPRQRYRPDHLRDPRHHAAARRQRLPAGPIDGVSFAYTFNDAKAKDRKHTQYFEVMGSRAIYHDGWIASAFGPRVPWKAGLPPGIREWTPDKDKWELYNLNDDWSQANDLADKMPQKLADMKDLFLIEFTKNQGLPIGGGLWVPVPPPGAAGRAALHRMDFPRRDHANAGDLRAALGNRPNVVTINAEIPEKANGVLYALGGFGGGLSLYVQDGVLSYEYNLFELQRTHIRPRRSFPPARPKSKWRRPTSNPSRRARSRSSSR